MSYSRPVGFWPFDEIDSAFAKAKEAWAKADPDGCNPDNPEYDLRFCEANKQADANIAAAKKAASSASPPATYSAGDQGKKYMLYGGAALVAYLIWKKKGKR